MRGRKLPRILFGHTAARRSYLRNHIGDYILACISFNEVPSRVERPHHSEYRFHVVVLRAPISAAIDYLRNALEKCESILVSGNDKRFSQSTQRAQSPAAENISAQISLRSLCSLREILRLMDSQWEMTS